MTIRMFPRFGISHALLLLTLIAVTLGWVVDRRQLIRRIELENRPISWYHEKHGYWSPSLHLDVNDTFQLESALSRKATFSGKTVISSQGMGDTKLRQPDLKTLESTISLLDDVDPETQLTAARLLALYLQASSGSDNLDTESLAVRVQFHALGLRRVRELLGSQHPGMRSAAALILGNSLYDWYTLYCLSDAFDNEKDDGVKLHLAWAYWTIGRNYPRTEAYLERAGETRS